MQAEQPTSLVDEVRAFLDVAILTCGRGPSGIALRALSDRLGEPLRVAVAGRPGVGKSTIVNAMLGAEVAPTRGSDRAALASWYRSGTEPRVVLQRRNDDPTELAAHRDNGLFDVALPARTAEGDTLLVEWPASILRDVTLVDMPGAAAPSPSAADALVYVMTSLGAEDIDHLEAFHQGDLHHPLTVNSIAVLSRIDDLGMARPDAARYGARVAATIAEQPSARRLCQRVVPVAGLVAQAAATLRGEELDSLRALAAASPVDVEVALGSGERFARASAPGLPPASERQWLLLRFGLFGVRLAVALLREHPETTVEHLQSMLREQSGIDDLLQTIDSQLVSRAPLLQARSALRDAKAILLSQPPAGGVWLLAHLERIEAAAHELNELRVLHALHAGLVHLRSEDAREARRLLGADGAAAHTRLGLAETTPTDEAIRAARHALRRWQRLAVDPVATPLEIHAAATVVRTCEGILEGLTGS